MKVFTTINPNGDYESQFYAISSWSEKFQVYSVNTNDEIEKINFLYPEVKFIPTQDTFAYKNKNLVKLNSILSSIKDYCSNEIVAIVNSDIILNKNIEININKRYLINGIVIGTRNELDNGSVYPFIYGYDIFIFNSNYADIFKNDNYVIGMPWWDYWIPTVCIHRGMNLYHINEDLIFHKTHDTNYDMDIWMDFAKKFHNDVINNILRKEISLEKFLVGKEGQQMDVKKFIEQKQISLSVI